MKGCFIFSRWRQSCCRNPERHGWKSENLLKMFVKSNLNLQKGLKKCNRKFNKESGNIRRGNIRKLKMRMLCLTLLCLCLTGFTPDKFTKEEAQKLEKEAMEIFNRYLDEELGGGKIESVSVHKGTRRGEVAYYLADYVDGKFTYRENVYSFSVNTWTGIWKIRGFMTL